MTLEALQQNPWNAVDRDLPGGRRPHLAGADCLCREECARAALAASRVAEITEPALAHLYLDRKVDAAARGGQSAPQAWRNPAQRISTVSPFLDPGDVQQKAAAAIMVEVAEARGPRAPVTAAEIDRNPWSIVRSDLAGIGPELLERVTEVAVDLIADALRRSEDSSHGREEAALWKSYAEAAARTYMDAYRGLAVIVPGFIAAPEPLTQAAIARNPRNAIDLDIPADASRELLSSIAATAKDLRRTFSARAQFSAREEDAVEFLDLSGEARQRQQDAEARLIALEGGREGTLPLKSLQPETDGPVLETDRAALMDMLGDAAYRAVNEPVPRDADAKTLERVSGDLDAALDRLDALDRSSHATWISPDYIAKQFAKAADRQEEVERRLEEVESERRNFPPKRSRAAPARLRAAPATKTLRWRTRPTPNAMRRWKSCAKPGGNGSSTGPPISRFAARPINGISTNCGSGRGRFIRNR